MRYDHRRQLREAGGSVSEERRYSAFPGRTTTIIISHNQTGGKPRVIPHLDHEGCWLRPLVAIVT